MAPLNTKEQIECDREIRRQQDREYKESLAQDVKKLRTKQRSVAAKLRRDKIRDYRNHLKQQSQPTTFAKPLRLLIRFPNGMRETKTFSAEDSIEKLFDAIIVHDSCPPFFAVKMTYPNREVFCAPQWYADIIDEEMTDDDSTPPPLILPTPRKSFAEESIASGTTVFVQNIS
ncbi:unnamed protein product [Caenorhabditis auriculariae]|uniref:UBX domain-containing protein n=1 Tax=Caenorhabditis auriculariae TaxID=2777116 RepID=A0A8S1HFC7_9PELO|nr:unnamed protein product [Caenorhabditis auriculariae]